MIVGFPPFYTGQQNNNKMFELIKKKAVYFPDEQRHNISMSENCRSFISRVSNHKMEISKLTNTSHLNAVSILYSYWRKILQLVWEPVMALQRFWHTLGSQNSTMKRSWRNASKPRSALNCLATSSTSASSIALLLKRPPR